MGKQKVILVIDRDYNEARERASLIFSLLRERRKDYSVLPEVINRETIIARCRNLQPAAVFLKRSIVLKKEFGDLTRRIKTVCPKNTQILVFDSDDHLRQVVTQVVTDEFRKRR